MTSKLETYTHAQYLQPNGLCRVFYTVHHKNQIQPKVYALDVDTQEAKCSPTVFAELLAIKYLLIHKNILGLNRSGHNVSLVVSAGAIKKIQKTKSSNNDMIRYGRFLQVRFSEAVIRVSKKAKWLVHFNENGTIEMISTADCQDMPVITHLGELHLTRHAVERYMQRASIASMDRAYRGLSKRLKTNTWIKTRPPTRLKTKGGRTSETWQLIQDGVKPINIVIVRTPSISRVVTVMESPRLANQF